MVVKALGGELDIGFLDIVLVDKSLIELLMDNPHINRLDIIHLKLLDMVLTVYY